MFFKSLCVVVLWMKVASALEGLRKTLTRYSNLINTFNRISVIAMNSEISDSGKLRLKKHGPGSAITKPSIGYLSLPQTDRFLIVTP